MQGRRQSFPQAVLVGATGEERTIFDLAPVSLWLEDYSALRDLFSRWREQGISDLRAFLREDLVRVEVCSACIRVLRVNRRTLALYEARDLTHLTENLGAVLRDDTVDQHLEEL